MNRARKKVALEQARRYVTGMLQHCEPYLSGQFDDLTEEEFDLVIKELKRIEKSLDPDLK